MSQSASRVSGNDRETARRVLLDHGFDQVAFAAAGRAPNADRLSTWLSRGFAASMRYLERRVERRQDPRLVVPGARTVIVVSVFYRSNAPLSVTRANATHGEIASYAQGADYHSVIERRLRKATENLRSVHPGAYRYYVDTGPVLERDWAQLSGIGWVGKNTCTIDRERGSFMFLGAIVTSVDFTSDPPATNHCGSCTRCIDACPTDAIVAPYELDSRACISYLTIEHRGEIAADLEPKLGNLVFGCDICQEVCPYNRLDRQSCDKDLAPRVENVFPHLTELAELNEEAFRNRFPKSAVRRAKFEGFLRNVIVALGNSQHTDCAQTLERLGKRHDVQSSDVLRATWQRAVERLRRYADLRV